MNRDPGQPSPEDWTAYVSGRLDDARASQIEAWLEKHGAPPKYAEEAALMQDDSFLKRVRQSAQADRETKIDLGTLTADSAVAPNRADVAKLLQAWPELLSPDGRSEPQPDQRIGKYRVLERVSQTRMGQVYRCLDESTGHQFALKSPPQILGERTVERFYREIKITQKLKHPRIVTIVDELQYQNQPVFVMPWVEGIDLGRLLANAGKLSQADVAGIGVQVAGILKYLRKNGVVHRDIKPSNLMLTESGELKLIDLGLALWNHSEMTDETLTESVQIIGSLDYLAPEQARNAHAADFRADIYSLGCTLCKLATGKAPFEKADERHALQKIMAHSLDPFPDLAAQDQNISTEFSSLLQRLCAKRPDERLSDLDAIADLFRPMASESDLQRLYLANVRLVPQFEKQERFEQLVHRPFYRHFQLSRRNMISAVAVAAGVIGFSQIDHLRRYLRQLKASTDYLFAPTPKKWLNPHAVFIADGNLSSMHLIDYDRNFEVTRFMPQFSGWNLAVTRSGKLFVATSEGEIRSVDLATNQGREYPNLRLDQGLDSPRGRGSGGMVYVDAKNLYITGRHSGRLYRIDTTTMEFDQTFGQGGFVQVGPMALGLAADASGTIYVACNSGVAKVIRDGKNIDRQFISGLKRVAAVGGFTRNFPSLYVADENRVLRYSATGELINPRFIVWDQMIDNMAFDHELDLVYLSNYSYSNRVDVYKLDGRGIPFRKIPNVGLNLAQMALPVAD